MNYVLSSIQITSPKWIRKINYHDQRTACHVSSGISFIKTSFVRLASPVTTGYCTRHNVFDYKGPKRCAPCLHIYCMSGTQNVTAECREITRKTLIGFACFAHPAYIPTRIKLRKLTRFRRPDNLGMQLLKGRRSRCKIPPSRLLVPR